MKDYRITVKVRNNRILKAIEAVGAKPGNKWCEENGMNYTAINDLIAMKSSPIIKTGELKKDAARLCEVLNCLPEDLWSNEQIYPLETNVSEIEMDGEQVAALMNGGQTSYLMDNSAERNQLSEHIDQVLSTLSEREQKVLNMRFRDDLTLEEVGKILGASKERVRQVEAKALRKLRSPCRASILGQHLDGEDGDRFAKLHKQIETEAKKKWGLT